MTCSKGITEKQWFSGFMKSHRKVNMRQLEFTSLLGATGFNKLIVNNFFYVLKHFAYENTITRAIMFNMHKTLRIAL